MAHWKNALKADPTAWLLEEDNPSVRYFALKDLLDRQTGDPDLESARRAIMHRGAATEILEKQRESAYLTRYPRFYTDKYTGLVWSMIALAELGATADEQIRAQCEYLLENAQDALGGFSMHKAKAGGGLTSEVIPCLCGNMIFSLIRLGFGSDARVQKGVDWLVHYMRLNDGVELEPQQPPYDRSAMCWGRHTCHMGVAKALKAFAEIPPGAHGCDKRFDQSLRGIPAHPPHLQAQPQPQPGFQTRLDEVRFSADVSDRRAGDSGHPGKPGHPGRAHGGRGATRAFKAAGERPLADRKQLRRPYAASL